VAHEHQVLLLSTKLLYGAPHENWILLLADIIIKRGFGLKGIIPLGVTMIDLRCIDVLLGSSFFDLVCYQEWLIVSACGFWKERVIGLSMLGAMLI
jgi:hypothetical protein